jgi:hypothetical protein
MIATPDQIKQLETFFASVQIPQSIKLFGAITYNNLPQFIRSVILHLKDGKMSEVCLAPRYWDLIDIRKALEATQLKPV